MIEVHDLWHNISKLVNYFSFLEIQRSISNLRLFFFMSFSNVEKIPLQCFFDFFSSCLSQMLLDLEKILVLFPLSSGDVYQEKRSGQVQISSDYRMNMRDKLEATLQWITISINSHTLKHSTFSFCHSLRLTWEIHPNK